jgi:hypothetical protein
MKGNLQQKKWDGRDAVIPSKATTPDPIMRDRK